MNVKETRQFVVKAMKTVQTGPMIRVIYIRIDFLCIMIYELKESAVDKRNDSWAVFHTSIVRARNEWEINFSPNDVRN